MDLHAVAWDARAVRALRRRPRPAARDPALATPASARPADGVPVAAVLADSHAALYAHGPGAAKATYGTGSSVMAPSETAVDGPRAHARLAHRRARRSRSRATSSPAPRRWTGWRARSASSGSSRWRRPSTARTACTSSPPSAGSARRTGTARRAGSSAGSRSGAAASTSRAPPSSPSRTRSATSSTCVERSTRLHADGGATASDLLMQLQADLSGLPVLASTSPEMSALGAADLARGRRAPRETREFVPAHRRRRARAPPRRAGATAVSRSRTHQLEESLR